MEKDYKKYEKSIKRKYRFGWTPAFEEEISTTLNNTIFLGLAIETIEKLDWNLVFSDDNIIEAKIKQNSFGSNEWTEKIIITYNNQNVTIRSVSLKSTFCDLGVNSKKVNLFIYAFTENLKLYDSEKLLNLEEKIVTERNMDDYIIPEKLSNPIAQKKPNIYIPIFGSLLISVSLGYLLAFISVESIYIIGLFEFIVAIIFAFFFKYLIKFSNYTNFDNLNYIIITSIVTIYFLNQFFQYQIILSRYNNETISFFNFIKLKLHHGLTIKSLNTGMIGLILSWVFQLGVTYLISVLLTISNLSIYIIEKVPKDVVEFVIYHLIKEKNEEYIRMELSKMGWTDKQDQDSVFEALAGISTSREIARN